MSLFVVCKYECVCVCQEGANGRRLETHTTQSLRFPFLCLALLVLSFWGFFFNFVIFLIFRITDKINIKNYYYILSINVSINFLNPILKIIIIVIKFGWGLIDMSSSGHVLLFDMV